MVIKMNAETLYPRVRHNTLPVRLAKGLSAAFGGLVLTAALSAGVADLALGWSPTSTAKRCFEFPE